MTAPPEAARPARRAPRRRTVLLLLVGLVAAAAGWYLVARYGTESTDDAFVEANVYRVSPKVPGRVAKVLVADNAPVQAGDVLVEIDPADYQARADRARAALALAQAQQREAELRVGLTDAATKSALARAEANGVAAEARLEQEKAALESARADAERARADLVRYEQLSERAVSPQRLDVVRQTATVTDASLRAVEKRVASAEADLKAAQSDVAAAAADLGKVDASRAAADSAAAEVRQAEAVLREAELALADTRIVAPATGVVTRKSVLEGAYVQPGQSLMAVVEREVWIIANFKETQLADMRQGQMVDIRVDAYGIRLRGHVDSIQAGTGSRFSLLPPENATGNYVKVVQRVPVKIVLDGQPDPQRYPLGPGMSVVPTVHTR